MLRLGGILFISQEDPEEYAEAHVRAGFNAAYCPSVSLADAPRIKAFREAFAKRNILIAEVGAWGNMVALDQAVRQKNLEAACNGLALADEMGALCCVNYIGSRRKPEEKGPVDLSEEAFDLAVQTVQGILQRVKPKRAKFSLEMMQTQHPNSVDSYLRLLKAIADPHFAVHIDPVNIVLSLREYYDTGAVIRDCFQRLGPWVVSCHAKDILMRGGLALHFDEVRPGTGVLNYPEYLTCIRGLNREVPLMIEHLKTAEDFFLARDFIRTTEQGLTVGKTI